MYIAPETTDLLLSQAQKEQLYIKLIEQRKKDFALANAPVEFAGGPAAFERNLAVRAKIFRLIHHKFAEYLNLLYIIDVPEHEVKALNGGDITELAEQVTFLILKREWQKVWFRNRY